MNLFLPKRPVSGIWPRACSRKLLDPVRRGLPARDQQKVIPGQVS
jgi:hypothetical protein